MKQLLTIVSAALALSACASAPVQTYQASAGPGSPGYLTAPSDNGRYTVAYTGAKGMSREQVAQYALLRAAELTAESNQEWFAVIDTQTQSVQLTQEKDDLRGRTGGFVNGGESTGTGAGGAGGTLNPGGVSDAATRGGPSTGGFGGGDVPYQVIERWTPPTVYQTVLIVQMGSGDDATFAGVTQTPKIFPAKSTAADIRGKMKQ